MLMGCFGSVLQDSCLRSIPLANIWILWETPHALLIPPALQVLEEWFSRKSLIEVTQLYVDFSALVLSKPGFLTRIIWFFKNQVIPLKQYVVSILSVTFRFHQVSAKCSCQAWQNFHSHLKLIRASVFDFIKGCSWGKFTESHNGRGWKGPLWVI